MSIPVFQLDYSGYYVGTTYADPDPRNEGNYLMPGRCVLDEPPVHIAGKLRRYVEGAWLYEDAPTVDPVTGEPEPERTFEQLKVEKNAQINDWRLQATHGTFYHDGKVFSCDALSRSDIDGTANHIALFGTFPPDFPGAWKAIDDTYLLMPTIDDFKAFYGSMAATGAANFKRAQALKVRLAEATTRDDLDAIQWIDAPIEGENNNDAPSGVQGG